MRHNFDKSLTVVLVHEGGFVNHPRDPGGATNRGVTQTVYDDWRVTHGLPERSVKDITDPEVMAVYKHRYWDAIRGDDLPSGVDYATFDFAVNSGVGRASRYLQRVASVTQDGVIGPMTLEAVGSLIPSAVIDALCDERMDFLKRLPIFDTFGKGWTRRVEDVRVKAKALA